MNDPTVGLSWERDFPVGKRAELRHTFTVEEVRQFADVTGDMNPLHVDPELAAKGRFGQPVVHGLFTAALFSRLLATDLPGPGTIYLKQRLRFARPVFFNQEVVASVEILRRSPRRRLLWLATRCYDTAGRLVVDGEAEVLYEGDAFSASHAATNMP